jgi:pantoate--beta-alanine ligase
VNQLELASAMTTAVAQHKQNGKRIGFVPTMGALHLGHLSLIQKAKESCDIVVVSIFVNPTQFNESADFNAYPRTLSKDLALLASEGVAYIFTPPVSEVYPENRNGLSYNFGVIADVMEGKHRPGHFDGVAMVVKRLFEIVQPDAAFFGEKDFQQLAIIRSLVKKLELPIEIIGCEIKREANGLAMSSRNERLSSIQRNNAKVIHQSLVWAKNNRHNKKVAEILEQTKNILAQEGELSLEYLMLADTETLQEIIEWEDAKSVGMFVAARFGEVRLIDNMILI